MYDPEPLNVTVLVLSFQAPYNQISYEIQTNTQNINTYFEINSNTGDISVRIPLYNDITDTARYTFTVIARDGGNPQRLSVQNAQVTINVIRNLNPPVFQGQPYTTSVAFFVASGVEVYDVIATDADTVVSLVSSFHASFFKIGYIFNFPFADILCN